MKISQGISFGAGLLAISSITSYALGLLRDRLLAGQFGASAELDVYSASFLIPDFIMNLFAAALTAAFIPIFCEFKHKYSLKHSWQLINSVLYLIAGAIFVSIIIGFFAAPWLTKLIAPGFDQASHALLINTTRLMLISPLLFSLSILFGSALMGLRRFIAYALSPVFYNLSIVLGLYFLAPEYGIYGAIIGVLIGAFVHMLVRIIALGIAGWRINYLAWHFKEIKKIIKLMIPRTIGLITWQGNLWVYTAIASGLAVGSVGIFNLARNFQSLPVSLFGIAFATALFPVLANNYAEQNKKEFRVHLSKTIRQVLFFTIPATLALIVLAKPLVGFFLGGNKFTPEAVAITAVMLAIFACSVPLESLQHVFARGFYARQNTVTPVLITLCATTINIVVSLIAVQYIGVYGLAMGFICYSLTQVVLLATLLRRKIDILHGKEIIISVAKIILAALIMVIIIYFIPSLFIAIIAGASIYIGLAFLMKMPELSSVKLIIKRLL